MSFRDSRITKFTRFALVAMATYVAACAEQAPPTATNGGSGGGNYNSMTATANPNNIPDCSATTAVLTQTVQGGGNAVKGCIQVNGAAGCTSSADFVLLATRGWVYSNVSDTWSSTTTLRNGTTFNPGSYLAHIRSSDGLVTRMYSFTIATLNAASPTTCNAPAAGPTMTATVTPNYIANCSAPSSQITMTIVGGGATMKGCIEFNTSNNCQVPAGFEPLSDHTADGWTYTAANDTWTFTKNTQNHSWLVPGTFRQFFKTADGTKSANLTFTLATTGSNPTYCAP